MKKYTKTAIALSLLLVFGYSFAQYEIKKFTINSGGGKMTGGNYEMNASIAQVDASTAQTNGNYALTGGFWQQNTDLIFKNGFE
jgi:hypothetical protein